MKTFKILLSILLSNSAVFSSASEALSVSQEVKRAAIVQPQKRSCVRLLTLEVTMRQAMADSVTRLLNHSKAQEIKGSKGDDVTFRNIYLALRQPNIEMQANYNLTVANDILSDYLNSKYSLSRKEVLRFRAIFSYFELLNRIGDLQHKSDTESGFNLGMTDVSSNQATLLEHTKYKSDFSRIAHADITTSELVEFALTVDYTLMELNRLEDDKSVYPYLNALKAYEIAKNRVLKETIFGK